MTTKTNLTQQEDSNEQNWLSVCRLEDIAPETGICALLGEEQVAIFRQADNVYAVSNYDPIGEAYVISRGIIGSIKDCLVVASPLYKQHFDLKTGACFEAPEFTLKVYAVRTCGDDVQLLQP